MPPPVRTGKLRGSGNRGYARHALRRQASGIRYPHGGRWSNDLHERLKALLYATKEPTLAGLLIDAIRVRVNALNDFLTSAANDERRRKLAFRAKMRT